MSADLKRPASEPAEAPQKKAKVSSGITEKDVGITEYVYTGESKRITAVIKQRYTDFLVNEIDTEGNVLHLTDEGFAQAEPKEQKKQDENQSNDTFEVSDEDKRVKVSDEDKRVLEELVGEEDLARLLALTGRCPPIQLSKKFLEKTERTKVHEAIRKAFENRLESATQNDDSIKVGFNAFRTRRHKVHAAPIDHNLGPRKKYLRFNMFKQNKETMEVASILAKVLGVPSKHVKYAGTKDRRGVTVQRASLENITIERANPLNKTLRGCKLGNFEYSDSPVNLAQLNGNEFVITLRDAKPVDPEASLDEAVAPIVKSLGETGFINYFGMQRFGTFSVSTHQVGKSILRGDWKEAGELILSEQDVVIPSSRDSRRIWAQTRDPAMALKKMPRKCNAEYSILSRLARAQKEDDGEYSANSYFNAIMGIPRNLRIMYGHAYQSYVWNVVTSKRIQLYGLKVVPGDLVLVETKVDDSNGAEDVKRETITEAHAVTQEEIDRGKYTIYDVVLPTPGYDVVYPGDEKLKGAYVEEMSKDGLDPFSMSRRVREFSLSGSYRNIMSKANGVQYWIRGYNEFTDELVRTDLEILELKKQLKEQGAEDEEIDQILPGDPDGGKQAVIIKMQLGTSTYATMALRELVVED